MHLGGGGLSGLLVSAGGALDFADHVQKLDLVVGQAFFPLRTPVVPVLEHVPLGFVKLCQFPANVLPVPR